MFPSTKEEIIGWIGGKGESWVIDIPEKCKRLHIVFRSPKMMVFVWTEAALCLFRN